jgi:hypothetical protein
MPEEWHGPDEMHLIQKGDLLRVSSEGMQRVGIAFAPKSVQGVTGLHTIWWLTAEGGRLITSTPDTLFQILDRPNLTVELTPWTVVRAHFDGDTEVLVFDDYKEFRRLGDAWQGGNPQGTLGGAAEVEILTAGPQ